MTKRNYKEVACRLYKEDLDGYIKLYQSIRMLIGQGLLDNSWSDYIWKLDKKLFAE